MTTHVGCPDGREADGTTDDVPSAAGWRRCKPAEIDVGGFRDDRDAAAEQPAKIDRMSATTYRGWTRPGPIPPGGEEPEEGETLEFISGNFKIFQYANGHRYSTDDVLAAWYGTTVAPRVERCLDLGSGIGSVAIIAAWRLPGARLVTVEAQETSVRLARKSVRYNGLEERFTIILGDLRDPAVLNGQTKFDLVLGSPPYSARGTKVEPDHPQAVAARIETRGGIADYEEAAERVLAPGGVFVCVAPAQSSLQRLRLVRKRDVIFKEGEPPLIALFAGARAEDIPPAYEPLIEPPLTIRRRDGSTGGEYSAVRMTFGFPPGNVPAGDLDRRRTSAMPSSWSNKDERQYEHIEASGKKRGMSTKRAKSMAAATVNKERASEGRTKSKKSSSKKSSSRKGSRKSSSKKSSSRKRSSKKR